MANSKHEEGLAGTKIYHCKAQSKRQSNQKQKKVGTDKDPKFPRFRQF